MTRIVLFAVALALVTVAVPADVAPVGTAQAQCYDLGEDFGCFNPCPGVAYLVWRATGYELYCTE